MASIVGSLVPQQEGIPIIDVKIVDGSALVHILDPKKSARRCSCRCCSGCLLKAQTRWNRGAGHQLRVANDTEGDKESLDWGLDVTNSPKVNGTPGYGFHPSQGPRE